MNKKISSLTILILGALLVLSFTYVSFAAVSPADKAEVPLTDPSKPALVKVSTMMGSISVVGYNGKTILVEAVVNEDEEIDEKEDKEVKEKAKGMMRIKNTSSGLTIIEENNEVTVKSTPFAFNRRVNISLKVPFKTSLNLKALNEGKIKVENVEGDIEVKHTNGSMILKKISGTVVANTTSGDVEVDFDKVNLSKPMAISTFNGDVTVTFPESAKFNLKMKTTLGNIYSDFKIDLQPSATSQSSKKENGKFRIDFDKSTFGKLNGGGEEVELKTYNGDIYIKKKK